MLERNCKTNCHDCSGECLSDVACKMVSFTRVSILGARYLFIVSSNPLDEVVLEGAGNNAVGSGLPHSVAFDGHLSQRNMHQIVWLLSPMEGTLKLFIDHVLNISLCTKIVSYQNRFMYDTRDSRLRGTRPFSSIVLVFIQYACRTVRPEFRRLLGIYIDKHVFMVP